MNENQNENINIGGGFKITRRIELSFWRTCILNAAGLLLAWFILPESIKFTSVFSFGILVVLIWFLNWILRPILVVFTLPFIIFTMGVGMLFINAFIIFAAARLIPGDSIHVGSYWAALLASFLVSVLSWGLALARSERIIRRSFRRNGGNNDKNNPSGGASSGGGDVIDI